MQCKCSHTILMAVLLLTASACANANGIAPVRQDPNLGAIGINIKKAGYSPWRGHPIAVYFAKLRDDGDLHLAKEFFESNYRDQNGFYLLNASPGRYIVVMVLILESGSRRTRYNRTFFTTELIKLTQSNVEAGVLAFMGEYEIRKESLSMFSCDDDVPLHYFQTLGRDSERRQWGLGSDFRAVLVEIKKDPRILELQSVGRNQ